MPSHENFENTRKYPRVAWEQTGELHYKDEVGDEIRVDVVIRSVSPEGLGMSLASDAELPPIGKMVTVDFKIGQREISLPGRVVWRQRGQEHSAMGIHLALALAKASMRHAYASWIVARLERSQQARQMMSGPRYIPAGVPAR